MARAVKRYADRMTWKASISLAQREVDATVTVTLYHVTNREAATYRPVTRYEKKVPCPDGYPMMEEWAASTVMDVLQEAYPRLF